MEAFFPLIITAVIYFVLANVLIFAISILEQKVNHKKCGSKEELRKKKQVMIKNGDH